MFSNEGSPREPPHVHVKRAGDDAKIWLEPEIAVAESYGFNSGEIARILRVVRQNRSSFLRFWHDHFTEPTVRFDEHTMWVDLSDARTLGVPLAWFPRLLARDACAA